MILATIKKYFFNCFLLTLPILVWNILLANKLPKYFQAEIFWDDIPAYISFPENILRTLVFVSTLFMPISIFTERQKKGLFLYLAGTLIYFASWLVLIFFPFSGWSINIVGFIAPSYTPLLWLLGIGMIGDSFFFKLPFKRWWFISVSILFLIFHNLHVIIIFYRTH